MNGKQVCPYYGRTIEQCDIGYGYISPYHVEVITRYCTSGYKDCGKYQALMGLGSPAVGGHSIKHKASEVAKPMPTGGLQLPLPLDKETITILQHVIRTPLTSIRSFAEILLDYPVDDLESQRRFLKIILEEAKRLAHVLDVVFGSTETAANAGSGAVSTASGMANNRHVQLRE
jgi:hypothetical protein